MAVKFLSEVKRTHSCGALTKADVGKTVVLFGWVQNRRDHGGAVFIDLRDREGLTQVVFEPDQGAEAHKLAGQLARTVPTAVLEHVAALARKHPAAAGNGAIGPAVAGWIVATDLTANRVGLILAGDLETAARAVATDKHPTTTLGAKERLRELLAYWSSEEHFAVRRHLGLEIA